MIPAKLLSVNVQLGISTKYYNSNPAYPMAWNATITVLASQPHSNFDTDDGFYDGLDIKVGDHVTTTNSGNSLEITSISSANASIVHCVLEDVDRLNAVNDPDQSGSSRIPDGPGILFEIENGVPLLFPLPDILPGSFTPTFTAQLTNKFIRKQGSLRGVQGTQGVSIQGIQGIQGRQGVTGIGTQGVQGITGASLFTFRVNFASSSDGSPVAVQNLPTGWSAVINGTSVTVTHNMNNYPKMISFLGYNIDVPPAKFNYRTPSASGAPSFVETTQNTVFTFSITTALTASSLGQYALVNVSF